MADIVESIDCASAHRSFTDRYFSRRYCVDAKGVAGNDHLVLFHSNRICAVALAPGHPLFARPSANFTVDFRVGNVDRAQNRVRGKGKKGGQALHRDSRLCKITCDDGAEYDVLSCVDGKLIEVNEALLENPALLRTHPDSDGYVAIVLSNISASDSRKSELLTGDDYFARLINK